MAKEFYRHEYGHTVQSGRFGPLYLTIPALQSLLVTIFGKNPNDYWTEKQADSFSAVYFGVHFPFIK